jgi:hypothetical protein
MVVSAMKKTLRGMTKRDKEEMCEATLECMVQEEL